MMAGGAMVDKRQVLKWTARAIEAFAVSKRTDIVDPETKGLVLRITPNGTKTWSLVYNRKGDGKKRRLTLGEYQRLGLSDARAMAEVRRGEISAGADPAAKVAEYFKAETVSELLDHFLRLHPQPNAAWTLNCKRMFGKDVRPIIGHIKLPDLARSHVRQVIERVRSRGVTVTVNRTHAALRRAFSWAVSKDLMVTNPALNMATDIQERSKVRALSPKEIQVMWSALDKTNMSEKSRIALRLVLVTGQRPGEVCGARKSELDLDNGDWIIPSKRAKNKQEHFVPLSKLAIELFRQAASLSPDSDHVFSSRPRSGVGLNHTVAMQAHALSHAMRDSLETLGLSDNPATPHDMRRTAATHMARLGISDRVVGRILNHGTELRRTITQQVYIHHNFAMEKRNALEAWASEVELIIGKRKLADNVLPLRA
jgi:integrase